MSTAIEFNNVSKLYRLGVVGTGALTHDVHRWWVTKVLRRPDPYLKIGETNDRSKKGDSQYVWALRDIDFKVEQGDIVGIIGKNGAGKSTLLKLLSRVTAPTTGSIRARGRIASLLEVGTGFHPELTGRENIYMNGTIMGMTRAEIASKLDAIVDFAGVERYLDTPVKRYSSGMTVRLGFAVAAFLEPDILVVDEVLAVGDAEFQKKAVGKMQDVASSGGRTVLFVSHNMGAVRNLCKSGIVLRNGSIGFTGSVNDAIDEYMKDAQVSYVKHNIVDKINKQVHWIHVNKIEINGTEENETELKTKQQTLKIVIEGVSDKEDKTDLKFNLKNRDGVVLAGLGEAKALGKYIDIPKGEFKIERNIILPEHIGAGDYYTDVVLYIPNMENHLEARMCSKIIVPENFGGESITPLQIWDGFTILRSVENS